MALTRALCLVLAAALPAAALELTPLDSAVEVQPDGERWLVLRYLAPEIGAGAVAYEDALGDLDRLCESDGLDGAAAESAIAQIVIVLMDRPVPRGTPDPEATQFIAAYRIEEGACAWE